MSERFIVVHVLNMKQKLASLHCCCLAERRRP